MAKSVDLKVTANSSVILEYCVELPHVCVIDSYECIYEVKLIQSAGLMFSFGLPGFIGDVNIGDLKLSKGNTNRFSIGWIEKFLSEPKENAVCVGLAGISWSDVDRIIHTVNTNLDILLFIPVSDYQIVNQAINSRVPVLKI